jgi:hypothetical protein
LSSGTSNASAGSKRGSSLFQIAAKLAPALIPNEKSWASAINAIKLKTVKNNFFIIDISYMDIS